MDAARSHRGQRPAIAGPAGQPARAIDRPTAAVAPTPPAAPTAVATAEPTPDALPLPDAPPTVGPAPFMPNTVDAPEDAPRRDGTAGRIRRVSGAHLRTRRGGRLTVCGDRRCGPHLHYRWQPRVSHQRRTPHLYQRHFLRRLQRWRTPDGGRTARAATGDVDAASNRGAV